MDHTPCEESLPPCGDLIRRADRHTCAVQFWLASRAPGAACRSGLGVDLSSTGLPIPLLNLALSKGYPPGTPAHAIDGEIEDAKAFFAGRNVPWYWWLGPDPPPPDMARHLERHGLAFDRPALPAMVARLPAPCVPFSPGIRVWQATTRADLQAASTIRRVGFRFPDGAACDYFEAMATDWLDGHPARLYLAAAGDGPPAAIGALVAGAGLPGVYVMATLPEWQRQGLGKAVLSCIMAGAAADGHNLIVLTASRFGYPLYRQFGFERIFDYAIYRLPPVDGQTA